MQPVYQSQYRSADWTPRRASQPPVSSLAVRNPRTAPQSRSGLPTSRSLRPSRVPIESSEQPRSRSDLHEQEAEGLATWDFTKIPVFPPDRPNGRQPASSQTVPSPPGTTQPRLAVGPVDDPLEREAGGVADQVMRTPDADVSVIGSSVQLSQKSATSEQAELPSLQTERPGSPEADATEAPGAVHEVLRAPGQPLDASTRAFMEPRFRYDFSRVRLHTDAAAAQSAKAVNARAYTVGIDVAFAPHMYAPHSPEGRKLLAHELAHTIQQSAAPADARLVQRQPDEPAAAALGASPSPKTSRFQDELSKNPAMAQAYTPIHGITGDLVGYLRTASGYMEVRNTDGEIVYSDELPLEHGLPIIDPALDLIEKGLKQLGYVAVGTLDTVLENNWRALGLPVDDAHKQPIAQRLGIPSDATAYKIGRGAGHALTLLESAAAYVGGAVLLISGAGEFLAGMATTPEGFGVLILPVSVIQMAAGRQVIIYGGALGKATLVDMMSQEKGDTGAGGGASGKKPEMHPNPAHDPKNPLPNKTPEPADTATVYKNAIEGERGIWYGKSETGEIYRYSPDNAGGVHFSGQTGGLNGIRAESIPISVRRQFGKVR